MNKIVTFFREYSLAKFLIPAGLMLIIFGSIMLIINTKNSNYIETESTITKVILEQEAYTDTDGNFVEATYNVNLKYTVNGKEYHAQLGGVSNYKVGEKMTIYYNPDNPNQITQTKSLLLPIIIIIAGIISFISVFITKK